MRFVFIGEGNCKGKLYDVKMICKKINGYYIQIGNSEAFVLNNDIQLVYMTEAEQNAPVYMRTGFPSRKENDYEVFGR